ncbi:MAG: cation-translocating P-type ATPase [Planctomycetota bacterium]|nr:cation-translocating P-type ATPase [Planctomycetota bacterium]
MKDSFSLFTARVQLWMALAAGLLLGIGVVLVSGFGVGFGEVFLWVSLGIGMLYGGKAAWDAIAAFTFDIDVLMAVGAALAAYIGHPGEGALLLFLFVLSGALEELAQDRTQREISALSKLLPSDALVERGGEWVHTDATTLLAGERVKVRPGERVPADAKVEVGESSFDQSAITGEAMPRHVVVGDELFAGTINTDDVVEARVLRPAKESSVQKILDLVTHAKEGRHEVQQLIDRLSQPYSIAVLGLSVVVFLVWWLGFGVAAVGDGTTPGALYTAITLLIVGSPCALIISTPTATLSGIARAARGGILFKSGDRLERLAGTGAMCLDKTGTLTYGRPKMYEVHPVAWSDGKQLLALAAALEADSTHPIATDIREVAKERGIEPAILTEINHTVAKGLKGVWEGRQVRLGSYQFVEPLVHECYRARVREVLERIQTRGHLAVVIAAEPPNPTAPEEFGQCAVLIMADALRPGTHTLVERLHALGIKPVVMLTGDNALTAQRVAEGLKLDGCHAQLMPGDKLQLVEEIKQSLAGRPKGRRGVAVIGDGVNDAPALAAADVSLAIGTIGTAAAMENADIVLLRDSISPIPWAIRLARRTQQTIRVNLCISVGAMVVMGVLTLIGSRVGHRCQVESCRTRHFGCQSRVDIMDNPCRT